MNNKVGDHGNNGKIKSLTDKMDKMICTQAGFGIWNKNNHVLHTESWHGIVEDSSNGVFYVGKMPRYMMLSWTKDGNYMI